MPSQPLNVRQGVIGGLIVLAVLAPIIALRSDVLVLTLVETLAVGMVAVFCGVTVVAALNRRRTPGLRRVGQRSRGT